MNKSLQNKINRIISKDYSSACIKDGQEWYVGNGIFMDRIDTKDHLLDQMDIIKETVQSAESLHRCIEDQFSGYKVTGNLYSSVLELEECLSLIEILAKHFLKQFSELHRNEVKARSIYYDEDIPF